MTHILYLSYTGMTDTLGESQVLAYLARNTRNGYRFHIVSAEKPDLYARHRNRIEGFCEKHGLAWYPVPYHKRPPVLSTLQDHLALRKTAYAICDVEPIRVVHCRGYLPTLSGLAVKKKYDIPLIFDMRGFWPDEKRESGAWASPLYQPIYRYFKRKEQQFLRTADRIVSLTNSGKAAIVGWGSSPAEKIGVIPTCVDFATFGPFDGEQRDHLRSRLDIPATARVLVYSGSLGGNYTIDIPFRVFDAYQQQYPESYFLILSRSDPAQVTQYVRTHGLDERRIIIKSVPFTEVSAHLMVGDAGLIFYGAGFSNKGRSPTKLGEYWASGLPAITLANIGDVDQIIQSYPGSGVVAPSTAPEDLSAALAQLPHTVSREQLRTYAEDYYALDKGVAFYHQLYKSVLGE